jgi:exopolysaccharide biosynthesis WecB/TagA/CpsF family protein
MILIQFLPAFRCMTSHRPSTQSLFGLPVFSSGTAEFLELLCSDHPPKTIGYLNAHTVNLAHEDGKYRDLLLAMDVLYADGMALVKTGRKAGRPLVERINAGDFLPRFLWMCAAHGHAVALVGGVPGVAGQAAERLNATLPCAVIQYHHHGFILKDAARRAEMLAEIRTLNPRFLLLGLGSPQQEKLALEWSKELPYTTIWCVGALLEYFSGQRRRAPLILRTLGLEWIFRLALEPRRLAARYLFGNPKYLYRERRWLNSLYK